MAMTQKEMVELFGQNFKRSQKGLEAGKSADNFQLIAINFEQGFKCRLMQGLITWRTESGSFRGYISDAIKVANEAVSYLSKASHKNNIALDFPIEIAAIISYLVDEPFNMPNYDTKGIVFDRLLSFELAKSLQGQDNESDWDNIISNHKFNMRTNLAVNTYSVYKELLFDKDSKTSNTLVEKSETLFEKRSKDAFYIGGEGFEGGGPDNDVTIDYRLAAVLKFISYDGESIHKWRED